MKDGILLLIIILSVGYGAYSFIFKDKEEPAQTPTQKTTTRKPQEAEAKRVSPSQQEKLTAAYTLNGIAEGADGYVAMINNNLLREGQQLDDITVIKISGSKVDVEYGGTSYTLYP